VCFRYTVKARIETNDVITVAEYGDHDDSGKVSNVAAVALRVCKKLVKPISHHRLRADKTVLSGRRRRCEQSWRQFSVVFDSFQHICIRLQETYTAVKDISQRQSKIIRTALQSIVVTSADDQVTSRDIVNCRAAM